MKKIFMISVLMGALPLSMVAQDDLYFVPKKKREKIRHSGTGRFSRVRMRPMSLWESGDSTGDVSINALFDGFPQRVFTPLSTAP